MTTKSQFQFSVLHYIHDSFTGEFLNIGLAFYSASPVFFHARFLHKYARLTATFPDADSELLRSYISRMQSKADELSENINDQQISFISPPPVQIEELLVQILPVDDSAIQFGKAQGGLTDNLEKTFEDLYLRLVETYLPHNQTSSRDEAQIWMVFSKHLKNQNVISRLRPTIIHAPKADVEFKHAWKNGHWKAMQPVSFDLLHAGSIKDKAFQYLGTNVVLGDSKDFGKLYYLLGKPRRNDSNLLMAYNKAKDLLGTGSTAKKIELIEEDGAEDFARFVSPQIEKDTSHEE